MEGQAHTAGLGRPAYVVERVHLSADKSTSRSGSTGTFFSLPVLTGTAAAPTNRQDDIAFLIVEGMMTAKSQWGDAPF